MWQYFIDNTHLFCIFLLSWRRQMITSYPAHTILFLPQSLLVIFFIFPWGNSFDKTFYVNKYYKHLIMKIRLSKSVKSNVMNNMEISKNGKTIATITRNFVQTSSKFLYSLNIYQAPSLKIIKSLPIYQTYEDRLHYLKFSPTSPIIVVCSKHFIHFYNYNSQKLSQFQKIPHRITQIKAIDFSPDGNLFVAVGSEVKFWDLINFNEHIIPLSNEWFIFVAFSKIGNKIFFIKNVKEIATFSYSFKNNQLSYGFLSNIQIILQSTITSIDTSPIDENEVVLGFGNIDHHFYSFESHNFTRVNSDNFQPFINNNNKYVRYMPEGKRIISGDLKGMSIRSQDFLYYFTQTQNRVLVNEDGTVFYTFLWQKIESFNVLVQCGDKKYERACSCPPKSLWSYEKLKCQKLNCTLDPNSTGKALNKQCQCKSGYNFNSLTKLCERNCSRISNANRINSDPNSCSCSINDEWTNGRCELIPCLRLLYSKESQGYSCQCLDSFIFDQKNRQCTCRPYQRLFASGCQCLENYSRNTQNNLCEIDCKVKNETFGFTGFNTSPQQCLCSEGFYFELRGQNYNCIRNCSLIQHAIKGIDNFDGSCFCQEHYFWTGSKCQLDCVQASPTKTQLSQSTCVCPINYFWRKDIAECAKNCLNISNALSKNSTSRQCLCKQHFEWNYDKQICQIKCDQFEETIISESNPSACECRHGYSWNKKSYGCFLNCSSIDDGFQVDQGQVCECKNGKIYNVKTNACEFPQSSNFIFDNVWVIIGLIAGGICAFILFFAIIRSCCCRAKDPSENQPLKKEKKKKKWKIQKYEENQNQMGIQSDIRLSKPTWKNFPSTKTNI